ncbi:universal stress protein [Smaragdicoccus niigatensis]|uniref:universal stress protein n=1 Tax=Smaragdicoccus niigatensis TaxID=359359 RepID=UPI00036DFEF4|nr:universal stress protein [Smaragdicoccus niigatensis]
MTTLYPRIFVGTDGSAAAAQAIRVTASLASALGVPCVPIVAANAEQGEYWANETADKAAQKLAELGAEVEEEEVRLGDPSSALHTWTKENPDCLFIVGSEGLHHAGSRIVVSVSNHLSHHSAADVLFTRTEPKWSKIGLATNGSPMSRLDVQRGLALSTELGARAHLVAVGISDSAARRIAEPVADAITAANPAAKIETDVLLGVQPGRTLANAKGYDLLVIGNSGMAGPGRFFGSTVNHVTHHYNGNLLLVNTRH